MNSNLLIVSENGRTQVYDLDTRSTWEVGRPYKEIDPDIKFYGKSVSRKHGRLQNIDGFWFYLDNNRKNGTRYNGKKIEPGINGRIKPVMLEDGDVLEFGGGDRSSDSCRPATAKYVINQIND